MDDKVYRSELTPVDFLRRSAYMFPEKTAVVYGGRRYTYAEFEERVNRLASRLRDSGLKRATGLPFSAQIRLLTSRPPFAVPAAGLVLVAINTRLGKDEVTYIVEHSGRRWSSSMPELEKLLADVDEDVGASGSTTQERTEIPTRTILRKALPGRSRACWRMKRRPSPKLHLGDDGPSEGRDVHAPGGVFERIGQRHRDRDGLRDEVPVDPPYVPLQRVDVSVGRDRRLGNARVFEEGGTREDLGTVRERRDHTLLRGPDRPDRHSQRGSGARAGEACNSRHRGAPPSPTLLSGLLELNIRPMHIYGLTETYGPMTTSGVHPEWEDLDMQERARLMARQGQGYCTADLVRVVDENMNDVERDGETMGEIVMHGNMVAKGYFENEEATEEAFEVAGTTQVTWRCGTLTGTWRSGTETRTSSSPAARTSRPSRWNRPCLATRL